jgi:hypothetical protein
VSNQVINREHPLRKWQYRENFGEFFDQQLQAGFVVASLGQRTHNYKRKASTEIPLNQDYCESNLLLEHATVELVRQF